MSKVLVGFVLLLSSVSMVAAPSTILVSEADIPTSASGQGSMTFGKQGDGVGFFQFDVEGGTEIAGSLLFAGEYHDHYPHVIVRMEAIDEAAFRTHSVTFSGNGALHDERVHVVVTASDGAGTKRPDTFAIQCTNSEGEIVFKADGELFAGDVVVGTVD